MMSAQPARPEKIIIKRTETKDQYGRTTSITTETIRHLGSYELVKKDKKDIFQPPMAGFHVGATYQGSLLDNELGSILEEDETEERSRASKKEPLPENRDEERSKSPVKSILKNKENSRPIPKDKKVIVVGDDEEVSDGGSVYSDAFDIMPAPQRTAKKAASTGVENVKVSENVVRNPAERPAQRAQKQLDEKEMYEIAYKVAHEKVYGNDKQDPPAPKTGGFRSYSLRGDDITLRKKSSSSKLSHSRSNSISSLSQRFIPTGKPKEEIHPYEAFTGFESSPAHTVESPTAPGSHVELPQVSVKTPDFPVQDEKKKSGRFKIFGSRGRKNSMSDAQSTQSQVSQNTQQSLNTTNSVVFRHTMRDNTKSKSTQATVSMNYNYQLQNKFAPPNDTPKEEPMDESTLRPENGTNEELNNEEDPLKKLINSNPVSNGNPILTDKTKAPKQKKKITLKNILTFKF
jgi:hypothetical protein